MNFYMLITRGISWMERYESILGDKCLSFKEIPDNIVATCCDSAYLVRTVNLILLKFEVASIEDTIWNMFQMVCACNSETRCMVSLSERIVVKVRSKKSEDSS